MPLNSINPPLLRSYGGRTIAIMRLAIYDGLYSFVVFPVTI